MSLFIGGSLTENVFVDGVVFRKNVSNKNLAFDSSKVNPKILLLAGAIDFQRTDSRLSSMDILIEQEDKYMEILVDKIMSLKPGQ
jgi:1-phosphatidylinositol-3-phosphate 5-kinase